MFIDDAKDLNGPFDQSGEMEGLQMKSPNQRALMWC